MDAEVFSLDTDHRHDLNADHRVLLVALCLMATFMAGEIVAAVFAHSLALIADAGHMVTDVLAIAGSVAAGRLAARPATGIWTYGLNRAEILAAAANGVILIVAAALITAESVRRLVHPQPVAGVTVLAVALAGVAVNLITTALLRRGDRRAMHVEGVFQHVLTDLYGFAGTALAGIVVITTGFRRADPIASLAVVLLMLLAGSRLLRASGRILLEAAPESFDLEEVRAHLLETPHVTDVHDLHAWVLTSELPALSAHVVVSEACFEDGRAPKLLDDLQACLAGHFDVDHSTFQLEPAGHTEHEPHHHS